MNYYYYCASALSFKIKCYNNVPTFQPLPTPLLQGKLKEKSTFEFDFSYLSKVI